MKHTKGEVARIIVLSLILTSGIGYALADWVAPTSAPPGENTPPPVNVGGTTQVKNGNFSLGAGYTLGATIGSFGRVAIGKTAPAAGVALDIVGKGRSDSTIATDNAKTLVTKDYVDARSGFEAINCGAGNVLQGIRSDGTAICASLGAVEVPAGAIMAFNLAACPAGWAPFAGANGRQIIGTSGAYPFGSTGGAATHALTIPEMPSHNHGFTGTAGEDVANRWYLTSGGTDIGANNVTTAYTGGNQPHTVMDPYIVLTYCRKT
jgi:hypothetical protein